MRFGQDFHHTKLLPRTKKKVHNKAREKALSLWCLLQKQKAEIWVQAQCCLAVAAYLSSQSSKDGDKGPLKEGATQSSHIHKF